MANDEEVKNPEPSFNLQHDDYQTAFADKIADKVYDKISYTFKQFMENIELGQKNFTADVQKWREEETKKMKVVEERLEKKKVEIEGIKLEMNIIRKMVQPEAVEEIGKAVVVMNKIKPSLDLVAKIIEWWLDKKNRWKIFLIAIGIILFFVIINVVTHWTGLVSVLGGRQGNIDKWGKNIKEQQTKDKGMTVRTYSITDKEIDSMQNQMLKTIKPIKGM
jgi:hypothetical protein